MVMWPRGWLTLVGIPEVGEGTALSQPRRPAQHDAKAEPEEVPQPVGIELARGGDDEFAQHHEATLALQRLAEEDLLARVVALVEAAGLLERLARAEDEASRGPLGPAEERQHEAHQGREPEGRAIEAHRC